MSTPNVQSIIIVNNNSSMGPLIVLPYFRPISIYEVEDNYDELIHEVKQSVHENLHEEIVLFLGAFKASLEAKSADPLFDYFVLNHGNNIDFNQVHEVFDALDDFIEHATDETRPMN